MQNLLRDMAPILLFSLAGCAATPPVASGPSSLPDAGNVALGQRAYADGPIIQPVTVLEDSRCPENVRCVWAGQLRLKILWLRPGGQSQPFEVTLGKPAPLADGTILLESASPARRTDRSIQPQDYRFAFRFMGGL